MTSGSGRVQGCSRAQRFCSRPAALCELGAHWAPNSTESRDWHLWRRWSLPLTNLSLPPDVLPYRFLCERRPLRSRARSWGAAPHPTRGLRVLPAGSVGSQLVCHWHTLTPWTAQSAPLPAFGESSCLEPLGLLLTAPSLFPSPEPACPAAPVRPATGRAPYSPGPPRESGPASCWAARPPPSARQSGPPAPEHPLP